MQTIASPNALKRERTRLIRRARTLSQVLAARPRRSTLDSFFQGVKDPKHMPPHLEAMYQFLGVTEYPRDEFSESHFLTKRSRLAHRPGAFRLPHKGMAKVRVVGAWEVKTMGTSSDSDHFEKSEALQNRTYSLPQFYAMKLGIGRPPENDPGGWFVPEGAYNVLAAMLLLRVGSVSAGQPGNELVDALQRVVEPVFALVVQGKIRLPGAIGLARMLEQLTLLQVAHTWLADSGQVQPAPLTQEFALRIQHDCWDDAFREAFNERSTWHAKNRVYSVKDKMALCEARPERGSFLDDRAYSAPQRKHWEPFVERDALDELWNIPLGGKEGRRWQQLVQQAEDLGLIVRVGETAHGARSQYFTDEDAWQIPLWSLQGLGLEAGSRYARPPRTKTSLRQSTRHIH